MSSTEMAILGAVLGALGVLWRAYSSVSSARKQLVEEIKKQVQIETTAAAQGVKTHLAQDPLNVRAADRFATHEEHVELCRRVQAMEDSMERGFDKLAVEGSRRAANINVRVDKVSEKVSALDERSQMTNARLMQVDGKIDRILERLK